MTLSFSQIQEQAIIDDIMDLEDKFADTLGPIPYFDSSAAAASGMMVPQTVSFDAMLIVLSKIPILFLMRITALFSLSTS